jgi:hypothetical protein
LTWQWLVTCDVVSASTRHLRRLLSRAATLGVPSRGRMDKRLRWRNFHSSKLSWVRDDHFRWGTIAGYIDPDV